MLDLNTQTMIQIPLPTYNDFYVLNKRKLDRGTLLTIMIPINEEEEQLIDKIDNRDLKFERGKEIFTVRINDIHCYGEIDFTDENTLDDIYDFKFLNYLGGVGVKIYSNYDYNTHCCYSPKPFLVSHETWNPLKLVIMAHGYLNKPQRVLLFDHITK